MDSRLKPSQNKSKHEGHWAEKSPHRKILVFKYLSSSTDTWKFFRLDKDRVVIGSVISADVRLVGDGVAPIHAVVERGPEGDYATVYDLASESGVFIGGKKIITEKLEGKEEITIGRYRLKFSLEDLEDSHEHTDEGRALFRNPEEDLSPLLLETEGNVEEIFDYRPTSKKALEVVMSWYGTILAVEHFVNEKTVTVGVTHKSDFGIPPILSSGHYPIAHRTGGEFVLNLDSQMKGVIQRNGQLENLENIRQQSVRGPTGHEVILDPNSFAKISVGEIDFYFSFTAAPPRLKRRRIFERDPFFTRIFVSSMILTAFIVFTLLKMKVDPTIEPEHVPDRIATILYQPEKFIKPPEVPPPPKKKEPVPPPEPVKPEPPKPVPPKPKVVVKVDPVTKPAPKPIPKVMQVQPEAPKPVVTQAPKPVPPTPVKKAAPPQPAPKPVAPPKPTPPKQSEAKEGEGARAKGAEGSRGSPDAKKINAPPMRKISRPAPHAGEGAAGNSQVSDEGNVDLLKGVGGKIENILGNSAAQFGKGGKNLDGFGTFDTHGSGGLALSGQGKGGGGTAEDTLGGLGKKGAGMGRVGTGRGAVGSGSGIVGGKMRVAIQTDGGGEAVVMGSIDRNAIADAIFAHKDEFRLCYEREINAEQPTLAGQVGTSFVIGASGRVTQAGIESSSLHNTSVERCILTVLKRIQFPIPEGAGIVEVHFPFKFNAIGH